MSAKATSMRWTTLVKRCGAPVKADTLSQTEWQQAVADGRFMTVYHSEGDWCTPVEAIVRHHGCCNTICKLVTPQAIPSNIERIIGMRNSQDAYNTVNATEL